MGRDDRPRQVPDKKAEVRRPQTPGPEGPPVGDREALRDLRGDVRGELRTEPRERRKGALDRRVVKDAAGNGAGALAARPDDRRPVRAKAAPPQSRAAQARERLTLAERPVDRPREGPVVEGLERLEERMRQLPRRLSPEAAGALCDIGRFRVVRVEALETFRGSGAGRQALREALEKLRAAGLVREVRPGRGDQAYLTLSREGKALARRLVDPGQRVYAGAKKPREMSHDAAIYEAYQLARGDLERQGSRVVLVRLDYQMKEELRREAWERAYERAKAGGRNLKALPKDEQHRRIRAEARALARAQDLPVDEEDSVKYPDLQIEFERPGGEIAHLNVEVVTAHYKDSQIAAKQAAGFQCFSVDVTRDSRGGGAPRAPMRSLAEELLSF